jgi:hypothetical protein
VVRGGMYQYPKCGKINVSGFRLKKSEISKLEEILKNLCDPPE